ncbi:hypothetical protein [Cellulomonas sp. PhB150]|uniref:hypothetical protein n=1 Tax=Cellulomonas sp. PhB150 TaxID=2485188 RepID=UPI000F4A0F65|nr:hypothetical protein [Cellulomonas sp. PhB150]ROS24009.1 hypothetical protein EDF34_3072 [Cellulomonas sp. PhB150]
MAHALDDAFPAVARPPAAGDAAKLNDEIGRLSQRLLRAQESYQQDFFGGEAEVPLDVQLSVIETYTARLETLNEQLRRLDTTVPEQRAPQAPRAAPAPAAAPEPRMPQPAAAPERRAALPGPGITSPDGSPLVCDGSLVRTEEAAMGEYVRYAAEQRWVATTRPSLAAGYDAICDVLLAALAHKHGVPVEEERESLVRHVNARYRRDYG